MSGSWSNCCCGCFDDGQFVLAERDFEGWRGVGWKPDDLPEKFQRLYRKVVVTHTKHVYYSDGAGGWIFWRTFWIKFTYEYGEDCSTATHFKVEGELNGTIKETYTCPPSSTEKEYLVDWVFDTDPTGLDVDELPPWPGFYPSGGSDTSEMVTVSEDHVIYRYKAIDGGGVFFQLDTDIQMSNPLDVDSVRDYVSDLLASVPLTKTKDSFTGVNTNNVAVSGYFGFQTRGADWNHVKVFHNEDCCDPEVAKIPHAMLQSDEGCACRQIDTGTVYQVVVLQDRKITYVPAWFVFDIPGGGTGAGSFYSVGTTAYFVYGYSIRPVWVPATSSHVWQINHDPSAISDYEVSASGQKALLARSDPDDWVVLDQVDEDGEHVVTCLAEDPVEKCYRAYYPAGADLMAESENTEVFVITESGRIIREIPLLTLDMEDDCPSPTPGEPDCPTGDDGESDHFDNNPCIPDAAAVAPAMMLSTATAAAPLATKKKWPLWASAMRAMAVEGEKGVGDTIERVIGPIGGAAYKAWRKKVGKPCKCDERRDALNERFPYEDKT